MPRERYQLADLTVDVAAVAVTRQGRLSIPLPQLSFDLLVALARRAPDVVPADDLIATVWAGVAVSDETLTQRVALLRRALGDEAKNPRYVRAVRGRGYQLVPAVSRPGEVGPAGPARARLRVPPAVAAAIFSLLGAIALLAIFYTVLGHQTRAAAELPLATRPPSAPELLSRAGAYLRRHQETDNELAIELYRRALRLEPANPQALAGLSLALGQRATKFNRRDGASAAATALARQALAIDPRLGIAHHALGLALDSRGEITPALAAYRRAAELEAQPGAALASAANLLQVQGHLAAALETDLRAARGGAETPIYLEVQIGSTLALLGFEPASRVWFERALELRPDNVFAAAASARARLSQGRVQEADQIAARALERGIRRPELATIRGTVALLAGDKARAAAFFRDALAVFPGFPLAEIRLLLLARRQGGAAPANPQDASLDRRRRELIAELRRGRVEGDEWPDTALDEALLAAGWGDAAAALGALDAAIDLGYRDADWLLLDPALAGLRGDPGFVPRIEKIRRLVDAERQRMVGAAWLPPSFLEGSAARM